jgi:hypothetical protein
MPNWRVIVRCRGLLIAAGLFAVAARTAPVVAQVCTRQGVDVTCDDGRLGVLAGDAIVWPDGTRSSAAPHPSVIIGNKASVHVGPGVMVGQGNGSVPLDDPNAPNKRRCAILDGVSYCY